MVSYNDRINTLAELGLRMQKWCIEGKNDNLFRKLIYDQHTYDPWQVEPFVLKSFSYWAERLTFTSLSVFVSRYPRLGQVKGERHIAVIEEENVPLSGLHDLICVLLAGHHFYARNINHTNELLYFLTQQIIDICPQLGSYIHWCEVFPKHIDAYLVFLKPDEPVQKSYFLKKVSLIREKRVSLAVISIDDTDETLKKLGEDVFMNFGLGYYAIRKIFVPETYDITRFFEAIEENSWVYRYNRYANNYDYHRSVFLMDRIPFLDNGFLVLRGSNEMKVPLGCLYFEKYSTLDEVKQNIISNVSFIQNVSSSIPLNGAVKPGQLHEYQLWEFEDHKDTLQFLITHNSYA